MVRKDKRKTEIYAFRVTPVEKDKLRQAGDVSEYSASSDVIRESALFTAGTILALQKGEITLEQAAEQYKLLLADLTEYVTLEEPGEDEKPAEDAP